MKKYGWILIVAIVVLFYLFSYSLQNFDVLDNENAMDILLYQSIWYIACYYITRSLLRWLCLDGSKRIVTGFVTLLLCAFSYFMHFPDKIEFHFSKTNLEKLLTENIKQRGREWNDSTDATIVGYEYWTDYPYRVPFIADRKVYVFGSEKVICEIFGSKPESRIVHIYGKWYVWYYENNEMPG